jgi:hypothetical protein
MRYLVGIPMLYGADHCREAIESVVHKENVDVLLIDNGAEQRVKDVIYGYEDLENVTIIQNRENIYVNPAWNQIIDHFLKNDYDYLLIMNSDLILHKDWKNVLDKYLTLYWDRIPVPEITSDRNKLHKDISLDSNSHEVFEGTPGVLIILNRFHAKNIYPIPETIKVWFGDNWIYEGLRKICKQTMVLDNLIAYHSGSQTVSRVKGISELIEQDKIEWEKLQQGNTHTGTL